MRQAKIRKITEAHILTEWTDGKARWMCPQCRKITHNAHLTRPITLKDYTTECIKQGNLAPIMKLCMECEFKHDLGQSMEEMSEDLNRMMFDKDVYMDYLRKRHTKLQKRKRKKK